MAYEERAGLAKNALGKQLFELMARKQSNLAVAADVPTAAAVLQLADQVWCTAQYGGSIAIHHAAARKWFTSNPLASTLKVCTQ